MINQDKDRLHNDEYLYGDISVKLHSNIVQYQKILVHLAPMEYKLLCYFLKNQGRVITRSELLINVWNSPAALSTRTIDVHIHILRKKLQLKHSLETVIGVGYILKRM